MQQIIYQINQMQFLCKCRLVNHSPKKIYKHNECVGGYAFQVSNTQHTWTQHFPKHTEIVFLVTHNLEVDVRETNNVHVYENSITNLLLF